MKIRSKPGVSHISICILQAGYKAGKQGVCWNNLRTSWINFTLNWILCLVWHCTDPPMVAQTMPSSPPPSVWQDKMAYTSSQVVDGMRYLLIHQGCTTNLVWPPHLCHVCNFHKLEIRAHLTPDLSLFWVIIWAHLCMAFSHD